ncbi:MAG: DUF6498-containing protein [Candidatus Woesearchaeota archaeon]
MKGLVGQKEPKKLFYQDSSLWMLLVSNLGTIIIALVQSWDLTTLMWVYWSQSIIIGFFSVLRMITLSKFSTEQFTINGKSGSSELKTKVFMSGFFAVHYGAFHAAYFVFLLVKGPIQSLSFVLLAAAVFFVNHLFSFLYNYREDRLKDRNISSLLFFPYARIIPMHLTIIFGTLVPAPLLLFLVLKILADLIMHVVEHKL